VYRILSLSLLVFAVSQPLQAEDPPHVATAKSCLDLHLSLTYQQDIRLAEYYADDAVIYHTVIDAKGIKQQNQLKGSEYKTNIKTILARKVSHQQRDTYTNLSFKNEGQRVRVKGTKNTAQRYRDPFEMLMGVQGDEKCMVYEMTQVSHY